MDVERVKDQAWATITVDDLRRDRAELDRLALAQRDADGDTGLSDSYDTDINLLATRVGVEMADLEDATGSPDENQHIPADDLTLGECALWGELVSQTGTSVSPRTIEAEILARVRVWSAQVSTACTCIEDSNLGADSQPTDADVETVVSNMRALTAALSDMGEAMGSVAVMGRNGGETMAASRKACVAASTTALARVQEALSSAKGADVIRDERVGEEVERLEGAERDLAHRTDVEASEAGGADAPDAPSHETDETPPPDGRQAGQGRPRALAYERDDGDAPSQRQYEGGR